MKYEYEIGQFSWVKAENTFYGEAWNLVAWMQDGSIHPEAFPSEKKEFYIVNTKTGNERRFRFVKELKKVVDGYDDNEMIFKYWQFESEDGFLCEILVEES